ncbi:MAG: hypothetical protein Q9183_002212 [Haloplaca sp. 2 TL-2023]
MPPVTHPLQDYVLDGAQFSKKKTYEPTLGEFMKDLNDELAKGVATKDQPFTKANVLLLSWEQNDAKNEQDCSALSDFLSFEFAYECTEYQIKGTAMKPDYRGLQVAITDFIKDDTTETLYVVFYSGHGYSNIHNKNRTVTKDLVLVPEMSFATGWTQAQFENAKFGINYNIISVNMEPLEGQVLHLLECCGGGGAVISSGQELLAASCSSDSSRRSRSGYLRGYFVQALMTKMKDLQALQGLFTVADLHAAMASSGPSLIPPLYVQPWYTKGTGTQRSATIGRIQPTPHPPPKNFKAKEHRVLLSIHLAEGVTGVNLFRQWLRAPERPSHIKTIKMLGYMSGSLVLLVTMPISLWDMLPENEAYRFIAFDRKNSLDLPELVPGSPRSLREQLGHARSISYGEGSSSASFGRGMRTSSENVPFPPRRELILPDNHGSMGGLSLEGSLGLSDSSANISPQRRRELRASSGASSSQAAAGPSQSPQRLVPTPADPYSNQPGSPSKRSRDLTSGSGHPPAKK